MQLHHTARAAAQNSNNSSSAYSATNESPTSFFDISERIDATSPDILGGAPRRRRVRTPQTPRDEIPDGDRRTSKMRRERSRDKFPKLLMHAICVFLRQILKSYPSEPNHKDRVFPPYPPQLARIITLVHHSRPSIHTSLQHFTIHSSAFTVH